MREKRMAGSKDAAKVGIGFGTALAIAISWSANKSILWAIIHGILSWVYVIYYAQGRSEAPGAGPGAHGTHGDGSATDKSHRGNRGPKDLL
jgi:hypothetical protein